MVEYRILMLDIITNNHIPLMVRERFASLLIPKEIKMIDPF